MSLALGALCATLWAGVPAGTEAAPHTQLEESRPADEAVLETPPSEIWLRFSTTVQIGLSALDLESGSGPFRLLPLEYVAGAERMQIRAVVADALPPGRYRVTWRTAGPDSHPIDGSFTFVVEGAPMPQDSGAVESVPPATAPGAPAGVPPVAGLQAVDSLDPAEEHASESGEIAQALAPVGLFSRWAFFTAIVLMLGTVAFRWAVLGAARKRGEAELVADTLRRLRGYAFLVGTLAVVAALLRLVEQGRLLSSAGTSALGLGAYLFASPWGLGWWVSLATGLLFLLGVRLTGKNGLGAGGWRLAGISAVLSAVTPALSGHAWGYEARRLLAVGVDVAHVLAAGAWMGSLAVLVLVALPVLGRRKDAAGKVPDLSTWVATFSRIALPAVGLLFATGVVSAGLHLGGVGPLFSTPYGRALLIKLAVLGGAAGIGFYNWRRVRPALEESGQAGLLRMPATVELILGLGVLLVTAALVMLHPPL